jgi:polyisoprenoid-binding protein YceI
MSKWKIDPDHSVAAFSIQHMMIAYVHGQFNKVSGEVHFDPDDIPGTSIKFDIDVDSIITGVGKRDDHLKSEDFFDQNKYPQINFVSSQVEKTGFNMCKVRGDLTIHGITMPVVIDTEFFGSIKRVDREDFGLKWNEPMEDGGFMVGKDVSITINIEADKVQ